MRRIKDYPIVGAGKSSLILSINCDRVFCSTKVYAELCKDPSMFWDIQVLPAHEGWNRKTQSTVMYPETKWVTVYRPSRW